MSKIIITEDELTSNINSAINSTKFVNPENTEFIFTSHKVNPLSINELTENINIIYKNINEVIKNINEVANKLKVEISKKFTVIVFKNKFVVKAMYNERNYCGVAFIIYPEGEELRFNYAFNNKNKL